MKIHKKLGIFVSTVIALALCAMLVGCGGGNNDAAKNFIGTWQATEMTSGGQTFDMTEFESLGLTVTLVLAEDGTFDFDVMGEVQSGTWKAKDASTCTITADGESSDLKLVDGQLVAESGDSKFVFEKVADGGSTGSGASGGGDDATSGTSDGDAADSGESDAADLPADAIVVADDDICTIVLLGTGINTGFNANNDPGLYFRVTNNSDRAIYVLANSGDFSVNGEKVTVYFGITVQPGESREDTMGFRTADNQDLAGGLDALVDVQGVIKVIDDSNYTPLTTYSFSY